VNVDTGHAGISKFPNRSLWIGELNMADALCKCSAANSNRPAVRCASILAVIMQALDTTIANVALPYMQAACRRARIRSLGADSYIVAAAIMTPPSGFLQIGSAASAS